jgi:hypothetical protein
VSKYVGAELQSFDMRKPSSRFVGTSQLTALYKKMTPGQVVGVIKRVVKTKVAKA